MAGMKWHGPHLDSLHIPIQTTPPRNCPIQGGQGCEFWCTQIWSEVIMEMVWTEIQGRVKADVVASLCTGLVPCDRLV